MNKGSITESIQRSLENFSLNSDDGASGSAGRGGYRSTVVASESGETNTRHFEDNNTGGGLELNSHLRLPYPWEQCLDLNTGEVYFINWKTGMKSRDDPRRMMMENPEGSEGEEDEQDNEEYESEEEESSEESASSSTRNSSRAEVQVPPPLLINPPSNSYYYEDEEEEESYDSSSSNNNINNMNNDDGGGRRQQQVLVLGGCKRCFMYFMVAKQDLDCPKCFSQLVLFDRSHNSNSNPDSPPPSSLLL